MSRENKLKVGDIFSIKLDNGNYVFGRTLSEISYGNIVEIFDYFSNENKFDTSITEKRLFEPIPIDTWGLFGRRKKEGHWEIIGHEKKFIPMNVDHLRYWGMGGEKTTDTKLVDIYGNDCGDIEKAKMNNLENRIQTKGLHFKIKDKQLKDNVFLLYSPWGDSMVKKEIEKYRDNALD